MIVHSQPPYPIHCDLRVANDSGEVHVKAFDANGAQLMLPEVRDEGTTSPVTVEFKRVTDPPVGALTLKVSVFGLADGRDSNELTALLAVQ